MWVRLFVKVCKLICDCFVTGKWKESEDATELLQLDDESGEEVFGDFEDLETGEKHRSEVENNNAEENAKETDEGKEMVQNRYRTFIQSYLLSHCMKFPL
jgi:ribosome biogenesis protein BMS1